MGKLAEQPATLWLKTSGTLGAESTSIEAIAWRPAYARYSHIVIDLSAVTFVRPAGVVALLGLMQKISESGLTFQLGLPENQAVVGYLSQIAFLDAAKQITEITGDQAAIDAVTPRITMLAPVRQFESPGDVEDIANQMVDVFQNPLHGFSGALLEACSTVVVELANNVVEHSRARGWVLAQRYRRQEGDVIEIAIADMGQGVRASLRRNREYMNVADDSDALRVAVREGASRLRDPHRGYGLHHVTREIGDYPHRRLVLASGRGRLSVSNNGFVRTWERERRIPGLLAYAWVPC